MIRNEDEQIAHEREQIKKMIGAQSAMADVLAYVKRLETTLEYVKIVNEDLARHVGELMYSTYHVPNNQTSPSTIKIGTQLVRINRKIDEVLGK